MIFLKMEKIQLESTLKRILFAFQMIVRKTLFILIKLLSTDLINLDKFVAFSRYILSSETLRQIIETLPYVFFILTLNKLF